MAEADQSCFENDPYGLSRFLDAQRHDYERALREICSGQKISHWMWYIFPQYDGLGFSSTAKRYAIKSIAEAKAYLNHPLLGSRLVTCAEAVLAIDRKSAAEIFGSPDDMKLRSCATLFAQISQRDSLFERLLFKFYQGEPDGKTLQLLGIEPESTEVIREIGGWHSTGGKSSVESERANKPDL